MIRRWRIVGGTVALLLLIAAGVGAGALLAHPGPKQGRLLVLLTVNSPVPHGTRSVAARLESITLLPSAPGANWMAVTLPQQTLNLPGSWAAPNPDTVDLAAIPVGTYQQAQLTIQVGAKTLLRDAQKVALSVTANQLTPLLFTFRIAFAGPAQTLVGAAAYGGNQQVNFGLQVAAGTAMTVPTVPLVNQAGRPASLRQYRGKVVVLASFLTDCQETCPLVAAALLQVQHLLNQAGLQNRVQIVEVTQDPNTDTSTILSRYQRYLSLPWPLLTGTTANIRQFWSQLEVPPVQALPWDGPAPVSPFTGKPEPYNLIHASVVDIVNPQGYVVNEMQDQPTLSPSAIPRVIYRYLDSQGRQQQRFGGAWTPLSIFHAITPLLEQQGVYTSLSQGGGAATVGAMAPGFTLGSTTGPSVGLAQQRGHPVLIDFWATWCSNCQADMRLVAATQARYRAQGLRVVLVDYQESATTVRNFLRKMGIKLPSLLDTNGSVAGRYGVPGLPVAVFVTAQGKIAVIQLGQLQQAAVTQDMTRTLSG
ncbi:MAG: redoxin domain-containing protein [Candidatus Dormibacteria bacterium]